MVSGGLRHAVREGGDRGWWGGVLMIMGRGGMTAAAS